MSGSRRGWGWGGRFKLRLQIQYRLTRGLTGARVALPSRDLHDPCQGGGRSSHHLHRRQPCGGCTIPQLRVLVRAPAVRRTGRNCRTRVKIPGREADNGIARSQIGGGRVVHIRRQTVSELALRRRENCSYSFKIKYEVKTALTKEFRPQQRTPPARRTKRDEVEGETNSGTCSSHTHAPDDIRAHVCA